MKLFEQANRIGLMQIQSWLPDGRREGDEWIAKNPTRHDRKAGSFKVNLKTGVWCDFAYNDTGPDAVSLYAYLFLAECERAATERKPKYKNLDGGIQTEAARAILVKYSETYFPDDKDDFEPVKKRAGNWDGFRQLPKGIKDPPPLNTDWFQKKHGPEAARWNFHSNRGFIVMIVVRFKGESGTKEDRPFTLWTDGKDHKWRCKALEESYPLYNLPDLLERQNDPILLVEGQKAAERASDMLFEDYVCTGWYGGTGAVKKTDFTPLIGRTVYFWPDSDQVGRKVIMKLKELECKLKIVYTPIGVERGWDIADAIDEGWTKEQIENLILDDRTDPFLDDDNPFPFKVLGQAAGNVYFFPYGSREIKSFKIASLSKGQLYTLADKYVWHQFYQTESGGISWDNAVNDIIRKSDKLPVFDYSKVRGTGAWIDDGNIIINTGEHLIESGKKKRLYEHDGEYVYERGRTIPYNSQEAMKVGDAQLIAEITKLCPVTHPIQSKVLAGWIMLAPWCGILKWRPHIWITGPKGSGKSWIMDEFLSSVVGSSYGIEGKGSSTVPGYRQFLNNCALPTMVDEMESDNKKSIENIEQALRMFREASSGKHGAKVLHGTSDGGGRVWIIHSIACFASIGAAIRHGADADRFSVINLKRRDDPIAFKELQDLVECITPLWRDAFHARTYKIIDELLKCVDIMTEQATKITGNRRAGDQVGTLLAGSWMISHDMSATAAEAAEYITESDISGLKNQTEYKADEALILDEILSHKLLIRCNDTTLSPTIGTAIKYCFEEKKGFAPATRIPGASLPAVENELEQTGIKLTRYNGGTIHIAVSHPAIKKLLRETPWMNTYGSMIARLDNCEDKLCGPADFAGMSKKFRRIDAAFIMNEIPVWE